ncbi:MAG: oxidoreductase [Acidimicrobiales bacterium]
MTTWTERDIPDLSGKTFLVTGANSGIGFEASRALAENGASVVMGCRNPAKAEQAIDAIVALEPRGRVELLQIDLADLASVSAAADEFLADHDQLDCLINNAGLMATPEQRTVQGFEMQLGVNHLAHFALTGHLIDRLIESGPGSRVVSISSMGHRPGRMKFDDLNSEESYSPWPAYFQSKLANLLFTRELQTRLDRTAADAEVLAVAAHPGASNTNLGHEGSGGVLGALMKLSRPVMNLTSQSAAMGALPTLRAATAADVQSGDYYGPDGFGEMRGHPEKVGMSGRAKSTADAEQLWAASEALTGVSYLD